MGLFSRLRASGRSSASGERAPSTSEQEALRLIDEGNALENAGQTAEALARYDAAVRVAPALARAHLNRGNALLDLGNPAAALEAYAAALAQDPAYASAHYNMGNAYWRSGRHEAALEAYRNALVHRPGFADAEVATACVLEDLGRREEAVECYRRALALDPSHAPVHANLGHALRGLGRLDEAAASYRRALDIDPQLGNVHRALGGTLKDLGQLDAAAACYRDALAHDPNDVEAIVSLGAVLQSLGKPEDAATMFRRALEVDGRNIAAQINLGNALKQQGLVDEAVACYRQALAVDPASRRRALQPGRGPAGRREMGRGRRDLSPGARDQSEDPRGACEPGQRAAESWTGRRRRRELSPRDRDRTAQCHRAQQPRQRIARPRAARTAPWRAIGARSIATPNLPRRTSGSRTRTRTSNNSTMPWRAIAGRSRSSPNSRMPTTTWPMRLAHSATPMRRSRAIGARSSIRPDFADAYHNLGNALMRRRTGWTKRSPAIARPWTSNPALADAWTSLGNAQTGRGHLEAPSTAIAVPLQIDPEFRDRAEQSGQHAVPDGQTRGVDRKLPPGARARSGPRAGLHRALLLAEPPRGDRRRRALRGTSSLRAQFEAPFARRDRRSSPIRATPIESSASASSRRTCAIMRSPASSNHYSRIWPATRRWRCTPTTTTQSKTRSRRDCAATSSTGRPLSRCRTQRSRRGSASDAIDILIDLSGHTAGHRLLTFARKPAPVQASWIGYPGTTGLRAIDYYIADQHFLPDAEFRSQLHGEAGRASRRGPFHAGPIAPPVESLPALANGYVTFGSFNRLSKLRPTVDCALGTAPARDAGRPDAGRRNAPEGQYDTLIANFASEGIARARLEFHSRCGSRSLPGAAPSRGHLPRCVSLHGRHDDRDRTVDGCTDADARRPHAAVPARSADSQSRRPGRVHRARRRAV